MSLAMKFHLPERFRTVTVKGRSPVFYVAIYLSALTIIYYYDFNEYDIIISNHDYNHVTVIVSNISRILC